MEFSHGSPSAISESAFGVVATSSYTDYSLTTDQSIMGQIGLLDVPRSQSSLIKALLESNCQLSCYRTGDPPVGAMIIDAMASSARKLGPDYCCKVTCELLTIDGTVASEKLKFIPAGKIHGGLRIVEEPPPTPVDAKLLSVSDNNSASSRTRAGSLSKIASKITRSASVGHRTSSTRSETIISSLMHHLSYLSKLELVHVNVGTHLHEIASHLVGAPITSITLLDCGLLVEDSIVIGSLLLANSKLTELDLSDNPQLSDQGAVCLAAIVTDGPGRSSLNRLTMRRCNIGDIGTMALCEAIVQKYQVSWNKLTVDLVENPAGSFASKMISKCYCDHAICDTTSNELRMCLLGSGGIGSKSSLVLQFVLNTFLDVYDPTIEDSYRKQCVIDGKPLILDIIDTAGQEEYSAMRDQYIWNCEAFSLGYSITSRSSFESVREFHEKVVSIKQETNYPKVLVAGRADLEVDRVVSREEGKRLAEDLGCPFFEVSAKLRWNIEETFFTLAREALKARAAMPSAVILQKKLKQVHELKAKVVPRKFPELKPATALPRSHPRNDLCDWRGATARFCPGNQPDPIIDIPTASSSATTTSSVSPPLPPPPKTPAPMPPPIIIQVTPPTPSEPESAFSNPKALETMYTEMLSDYAKRLSNSE
ncbi:Ras GTPase [Pelomyxa schiedti]|nr:Ras GTPase [Pelomyxa schiedti]